MRITSKHWRICLIIRGLVNECKNLIQCGNEQLSAKIEVPESVSFNAKNVPDKR